MPLTYRLIHADVLDGLRALANDTLDSVVTDPPYGLGFMGKTWDTFADFQEWCEAWARECLRVLKPGGHLIAFGGTRTYHRLACAVEDAGFEIRDQLQWLYGSGFPKSKNLSGEWEGWGTALKPAHEPIVLARKPFRGTVAANVQAHGTGAMNIDGCRVAVSDEDYARNNSGRRGHADNHARNGATSLQPTGGVGSDAGRWPANVLLDEEAAAILDEQSGELTSGDGTAFTRHADKSKTAYGAFAGNRQETGRAANSGGASRFFYTAKAGRSEREEGLYDQDTKPCGQWSSGSVNVGSFQSPNTNRRARNHHPTVKPVDVMRWLVRLVTPPGGSVLDPFVGSGTTGMAAIAEQFSFIGIEREAEYIEIARRRIASVAPLLATEIHNSTNT